MQTVSRRVHLTPENRRMADQLITAIATFEQLKRTFEWQRQHDKDAEVMEQTRQDLAAACAEATMYGLAVQALKREEHRGH